MPVRSSQTIKSVRNLATSQNTVIAEELSDLTSDLDDIGNLPPEWIVEDVLDMALGNIETLAKRYAPRDTGELARSIEVQQGPTTGTVVATADHAVFVEFGTWSHHLYRPKAGTYEIRPRHAQALRFEIDGEVIFTKKVDHPGIEAQPFMAPAVAEVVPDFVDLLASKGVRLIVDGVR